MNLLEGSQDEDVAELLKDLADPETKKKTRPAGYINPADIRDDDSPLWEDVAGVGPFQAQIYSLLTKAVLLPRGDEQYPIAASYLMLPSAFCSRVPILLSQGGSGSGKSTIAHLACFLHDTEPLGAGSTFPAIRNEIRKARFYDAEKADKDDYNERNCCIAWEDINSRSLRDFDGKIFDLLKLGVDRKGKISIANLGGTNMEFPVFSPKLVSSIHPFYSEHEFRELIRRIVVIEHKRFNWFSADDIDNSNKGLTPDDLIDLQGINWENINRTYQDFWMDSDMAQDFLKIRKQIKKPSDVEFPTAYFDMSKDLMATGVTCGYWASVREAIDHMSRYYCWHFERIESMSSGTEMILKGFIKRKLDQYELQLQKAKLNGTEEFLDEYRIETMELKNFLDDASKDGQLEINNNPRERTTAMESLGYKLKTCPDDHKNYWYPINS